MRNDGQLNDDVMARFVEDIVRARHIHDTEVALVSSGAVSAGRAVVDPASFTVNAQTLHYNKNIVKEQVLAAIGQGTLIGIYKKLFHAHHAECAQILTTRRDFAAHDEYLSLKTVTETLLRMNICPIFNENDVLSPAELDFSDNDQLAYMVAAMIGARQVIICTNVDGVYDGPPSDPSSRVITHINDIAAAIRRVDDGESTGKGGMRSKLQSADVVTSLGIAMRIVNGHVPHVLARVLDGEQIGTYFRPKRGEKSTLKKWLATAAVENGDIVVSTFLADRLRAKNVCSILFVGIEDIRGNFRAGDTVRVCDTRHTVLARGRVRYDADALREQVQAYKNLSATQKAQTPTAETIAVHYDYLVHTER